MSKTAINKRTLRSKGLSLIEVLVVVAILALVFTGFFSIYSSAQKYITNKEVLSNIFKDSRIVISMFIKDTKEAVEVMPGPIVINSRTFYSSETCIIFKMASIDASGVIIDIETDFDYIVYCLNAENQSIMERVIQGKNGISSRVDSTRTLSQNLDSVTLVYADADGVEVSSYLDAAIVNLAFTLKDSGVGRTYLESFKTSTKLRNKAKSQ
jgi:prepilin-type N-terminal cleavage/methylation domain-containing protein